MHNDADYAVKTLLNLGEELFVTSQNLIEFWSVATRPLATNGLELTIEQAIDELDEIEINLSVHFRKADIWLNWERTVMQHRV